jgi:hypothetical protein
VSWLKLDLLSTEVYPESWLPAPPKEWWQMELDEPDAGVGMVRIRMPHESYTTASHYPQPQDWFFKDCRQWWLYAPNKCYRQFMRAIKPGVHSEMVTYPNFPGFSQSFLHWLFDQHDSNADGSLTYEEYRSSQEQQAADGTYYTMWKGFSQGGYADDNAAHLWNKLDSFHVDYADPDATGLGSGDGVVTRSEFTNGILSMPLSTFCDYFENTANTHGSNFFEGTGLCQKTVGKIPEPFGYFPNDGSHGFVVSVSDTPCTDQEGCPTETDNNTTICELRLHRTSGGLAQVDCGGAVGKYVQLSLPGTGNRLLPADVDVTVHRSSVPLDLGPNTTFEEAIASTNPALKTVCYGVLPRKVPAANDPDLLANAKLHPKTIVDDNPEDPIFWSTCYDRVVIREWLPLLNEAGAREDTNATLEYSFKQGEQCLACDSLRNNHLSEYNMTTMATPRWWLQAEGECVDCNREFFPEMYPPCTCTNGTAAMWQYGGCDVAGAEDCSACNAGYTLNGQVCDANICTCTGGTAAIATDGSCDVSNAEDCTACNAGYTLNGQVCDATI